jgi:hypothetical protein
MTKDLTGQKFGRLTAIGRDGKNKFGHPLWRWRCSCGNEISRPFQPIKEGRQISCGCARDEGSRRRKKHGRWKSRTYKAWTGMKARCAGTHGEASKYYEGRISVCDRWLESFENFFADMGECPEGYSIERQNNDEGYSPDNCRWIPRNHQSKNTRRTVWVKVDGDILCLKDACERKAVPYARIRSRIRSGMDAQAALDMP